MTVYNLYIFNRNGVLIFYQEWARKKTSSMSLEEEARLLYGMLFSLKSFANRIAPLDTQDGLQCFRTNKYKMTLFESPTGLKFVCNTDVNAQNVREMLQNLYTQVYLEYVVNSPACEPTQPVQSELFKTRLDELVRRSAAFSGRAT